MSKNGINGGDNICKNYFFLVIYLLKETFIQEWMNVSINIQIYL